MAIAPSRLGRLIESTVGHRIDEASSSALHATLREQRLVTPATTVEDVEAAMGRVRAEFNHADPFNSPNERLRVHLEPFLTTKGREWAEPLRSTFRPVARPAPRQSLLSRFRSRR